MHGKPAPIALFTYNRLKHTHRTVESLAVNEFATDTDLIIFSDGPKSSAPVNDIIAVREYLATIQGFKSVSIITHGNNLGLANSIISGVTDVLKRHERVIVIEDDMVTSPYFLRYMNESLDYYDSDDRVASIHGYVYPVKGLPETLFLRGADCWGWSTWRRGWSLFNPDGQYLLNELRRQNLARSFDFNGAFGYTSMLEDQIAGRNDSWAVRWYASVFLQNKLTLYPGRSLVHNTGMDDSGTHCVKSERFDAQVSLTPIKIGGIPVQDSDVGRHLLEAYFRNIRKSLPSIVVGRIRNMFKR